jgi:alpha-beta hydrolase superfamily lysophospholipase
VAESVELTVDVTDAAAMGEPCQLAATVHLPEPEALAEPAVVCFAFPGGGYGRRYYSFDMPGDTGGGQAGWHAERGWIVVTVDHLGVGDSTIPAGELTYENIAAANAAAVDTITAQLAKGTVADGFPPVAEPVRLGLGQSMGGCFLIVAQGRHEVFDVIGVLGYSAVHTHVPSRPGTPDTPMPWMPRGTSLAAPIMLNQAALAAATTAPVAEIEDLREASAQGAHPFQWAFHYDGEPAEIVAQDMDAVLGGPQPPWRSTTTPPCAIFMVAPGTVATEAAAIHVPVLSAMGERDVVPDPRMEPFAYRSASDITVYVCERMAHMHNFADTRHRFWTRIHHWGNGVAAGRQPTSA